MLSLDSVCSFSSNFMFVHDNLLSFFLCKSVPFVKENWYILCNFLEAVVIVAAAAATAPSCVLVSCGLVTVNVNDD